MRSSASRAAIVVLLCLAAGEARGYEPIWDDHLERPTSVVFRQSVLRDRKFKLLSDHYVNVLSYRPRYPLRVLERLASTGLAVDAGSLSSSDLFLDQTARVRLPFSSWLLGDLSFIQAESWDERSLRAVVEMSVLIPGTGPRGVAKPLELANVPPAWGLFAGGSGELNAFKEFIDLGLHAGYRNRVVGARVDLLLPEFFFNQKNRTNGEVENGRPVAVLGQVELAPFDDGPFASAWVHYQARVRGTFPEVDVQKGTYDQLRAGVELVVPFGDRSGVLDLDVNGETTHKRRTLFAPSTIDETFGREAGQVWIETNFYLGDDRAPRGDPVPPEKLRDATDEEIDHPWGVRPPEARRGVGPELTTRPRVVPRDVLAATTPAGWATTDVLEVGALLQSLRESTVPRGRTIYDRTLRTARVERREAYGTLGYVLTLPSLLSGLALHPSAHVGYLHARRVPAQVAQPKERDDRVVAKVNGAIEYRFSDRAVIVLNATLRLDVLEFGGGNVQIVLRF